MEVGDGSGTEETSDEGNELDVTGDDDDDDDDGEEDEISLRSVEDWERGEGVGTEEEEKTVRRIGLSRAEGEPRALLGVGDEDAGELGEEGGGEVIGGMANRRDWV